MADVFLSYARDDVRRAKQVADALTAAGYDVFWDVEIPPGLSWADYLQEKLTSCKAALVLWSAASVTSEAVREEARIARQMGKFIPVMLDGVPPPFGFGEIQAADLRAWNGEADSPQWRHLLEGVARAAGRKAAPSAATPAAVFAAAPAAAQPSEPGWRSEPQSPPLQKAKDPGPPWRTLVGSAVAALVILVIIGLIVENDGAPAPSTSTDGLSVASSEIGDLPAQVRQAVEEARQAQKAGREAADEAAEAAKQANRVLLQMQQGQGGYESTQLDQFTTLGGDLNAIRAGNLGAVNMNNAQTSTRFAGLLGLDQSTGLIKTMIGAIDNGRGASGLGRSEFSGQSVTSAGRDTTPRHTAEGRGKGIAGSYESEGVGAVNFADGRRYEGQWRTRGQDVHLLRHGLGVTYSVDGEVAEAGRFENDKLVGPY